MKKLLIISISLIMISYCSGETSSSNDQVMAEGETNDQLMVDEEKEEKDLYIIDYPADEVDVDWLVGCLVSKGWDNIPKIEEMGNTVNLIFEGPWDGSLYDSLADECEEERRADEGDHQEDEGDHQEDEGIEAKKAEEILQENLGSYAGLWQEPGVEWIDFNFNTEYILCDDPDGYCAGWEQNASQECKDS